MKAYKRQDKCKEGWIKSHLFFLVCVCSCIKVVRCARMKAGEWRYKTTDDIMEERNWRKLENMKNVSMLIQGRIYFFFLRGEAKIENKN